MESVLIEIDDMVSELRELVDSLTIYIEDKPVSKQVRDGVSSFLQHLTEYSKSFSRRRYRQTNIIGKKLSQYMVYLLVKE
ncbi:hypothetical protein QW180_29910 [Vibrio sinaloensis]|nr:hypothetical protein [Vibrio sinaloensis]